MRPDECTLDRFTVERWKEICGTVFKLEKVTGLYVKLINKIRLFEVGDCSGRNECDASNVEVYP